MKLLAVFVTIAVLGYAAMTMFLFLSQERLVYYPDFPTRTVDTSPRAAGLEFEQLTIATEDGERLDAWYIPATSARGTVIFFHGNAGNMGHRLDTLRILNDLSVNCLIFDYRGYGRSTGKPGELGTYRDAMAMWRYLVEERDEDPARIVLFGRSLGAAVAAWLATRVQAAGLVMESAFISVADLGSELYPMFPVRLLARIRYDSRRYLRAVRSPVLIAHSRQDEVVPFRHGQVLFQVANEPKQFLELAGSHGNGFLQTGAVYRTAIGDFLQTALSENGRAPEPQHAKD